MPLGDSITRGSTGSWNMNGSHIAIGYRGSLFNALKTRGYNIDFVGTRSDGPSSIPYPGVPLYYDYDNEGHSGWQAVQPITDLSYPQYDMSSHLDSFLVENPPNIVLLQLGTNDLEDYQPPDSVVGNIGTILDTIFTFDPNIVVFVAKIPNRGNQVYSTDSSSFKYGSYNDSFSDPTAPINIRAKTSTFNKLLGSMISSRIIKGEKLVTVDMEHAITNYNEDTTATQFFPYGEMWDSFHPNQRGYKSMANVWFNAVNDYFIGRPVLASPANDSTNLSLPVTLTWGIASKAVSYLVQVSLDSSFTPDSLIYNKLVTQRYVTLNDSNSSLTYGETYYWRIAGENSQGQTFYSNVWHFSTKPVFVAIKVYLQGPYAGGDTMRTTLNRNHLIPRTEPYNLPPWNYAGPESVATVPSGIVDWVLVELRKGTEASTKVAERAAFLRKDGSIVDLNGKSPLKFSGVSPGKYFIVVRQRNHLPVMSADTISLPDTVVYNFTTSESAAFGKNSMADLGGGRFGMIAGDNDHDHVISASDYNSIARNLFKTGYNTSDDNLDGVISAADYNYVSGNLFRYSKVP